MLGKEKQATYPSTVAYVARLIIRRFNVLGILDEERYSMTEMGVMEAEHSNASEANVQSQLKAGKECPSCGV